MFYGHLLHTDTNSHQYEPVKLLIMDESSPFHNTIAAGAQVFSCVSFYIILDLLNYLSVCFEILFAALYGNHASEDTTPRLSSSELCPI